jgi:uncharacterized membrane protein YphA (DoxX/SURF4 family)
LPSSESPKADIQHNQSMKKTIINSIRLFVGILFIFSGLIKANDPLGLSYKMQEFFETWHMSALDNYTLAFSILMIVFEILAGVAVIIGWRMKIFAWLLLLLIIFFIFLTGYAVFSGKIKECGCFGNCIPLQAMGSFLKDLLLLLLIAILFYFRNEIKPAMTKNAALIILSLTIILSFSIQWYVLRYLPFVDCLPFKKGASIPEKMIPPPGSVPDSTVISFVYEKDKKTLEFTADKIPADLDSTYRFIKRYDKLIRKGNAEPEIKDFSLNTSSGTDTTKQILDRDGYKILLFSRSFPESNPNWNKAFTLLITIARTKNIPVYFVTSNQTEADYFLKENALSHEIPVFGCDATAIKTAARTDPTLYLLKKGTIADKWGFAAFESAIHVMAELPVQQIPNSR